MRNKETLKFITNNIKGSKKKVLILKKSPLKKRALIQKK